MLKAVIIIIMNIIVITIVLLLLRSSDEKIFSTALSLAHCHGIDLWEVHMSLLESLLTTSRWPDLAGIVVVVVFVYELLGAISVTVMNEECIYTCTVSSSKEDIERKFDARQVLQSVIQSPQKVSSRKFESMCYFLLLFFVLFVRHVFVLLLFVVIVQSNTNLFA